MIWFGWVLWHINHCRLFNANSSLYIYIKYIWFGLGGFYGISTIVYIGFKLKGFSTWGERDTISLCWLLLHHQLSTQPMHGARSAQSRLASPSSESQPSSSKMGTQLTAFSQISAHTSSVWCHSNTPVSIPIWDFYFDISEWHILSVRAWTPALMLHLTDPCAKRKVLSLTKPKGKIYKTKSLHHYMTTLTQEDFHWAFQKLLEQYNKCIAAGGDYFEGD